MNRKIFSSVFIALLFLQVAVSQVKFGFSEAEIKARLKTDISTLSSDVMEGREAGKAGEKKAASYIEMQMQQAGLQPMFNGSYLQSFEFQGDWTYGPDNFFAIGQEAFQINSDFFVMPSSASARIVAPGVYVGYGWESESHNDYINLTGITNRIFFMEYYLPPGVDKDVPRIPLEILQRKISIAQGKGALGVVFVNTRADRNDPPTSLRQQLGRESIPVLFVTCKVFEQWQKATPGENIFITASLRRETFKSYNVAGYLNNNAQYTVVVGAHYDHLGFGGSGSRIPGANTLHPGADDNASGTAGMLETARYFIQSEKKNHNYIFIAFSAEEKGLLGSQHFANSDAYNMTKVNYMFNYDMLGRLENSTLTLYGTGSSPVWDSTIDQFAQNGLAVRKSPSGVGGSDHTSFYNKGIPVLFFFSGMHDDYHRPTDTEDKINYPGMVSILNLSHNIIASLNIGGKLPFTETSVAGRATTRRSGVALGLMPDHAFNGDGLRVQAVSENNPAQRAGIKGGDVIIRIDDVKVSDIQTYMQALAGISANAPVVVRVVRDGREMDITVNL